MSINPLRAYALGEISMKDIAPNLAALPGRPSPAYNFMLSLISLELGKSDSICSIIRCDKYNVNDMLTKIAVIMMANATPRIWSEVVTSSPAHIIGLPA